MPSRRPMPCLALPRPCRICDSLYNTLAVQIPPTGSLEPVRTPGLLNPSTLPSSEPARVACSKCARCLMPACRAAHCSPLSFLLITNHSDPLFCDILGTLQGLAHAAEHLVLPTPRDASLTALAKPPFHYAPPLCLTNHHKHCSRRDPLSGAHARPRRSLWGWQKWKQRRTEPAQFGVSARARRCCDVLGSSWFAVLYALRNVHYVLTTRGIAPPGSAALCPNAGATSGTPSKRGGALAEGPAGSGRQQLQRQQSRKQAAPPLLPDLDPERSAFRCECYSERFGMP